MRKRDVAGAGLVSVTLGALGCGEPARPAPADGAQMFATQRVEAGEAWRRYLEPKELHAAWAPPSASPWRPFYKPTLIAAVAVVKDAAGPVRSTASAGAVPGAARLCEMVETARTAVVVDLSGEASVAWGAALIEKGYQPVVTFNNWPHHKGLLALERPLGALLLHAEKAAAAPARTAANAPPVFLLERGRLGDKGAAAGAGTFDNRYFHSVTDFPDAARFRTAGITRLVYVNLRGTSAGAEEDDLNAWFAALAQGGIGFTYVTAGLSGLAGTQEVVPAPRTTIFTPAATASYASSGSGHTHRPYGHYYTHYHGNYWRSSPGTWGSSSSGGGGSGGWSS